ncbi:MAG TPA: flagellar biosynthesis anti-sigma factor FlgM [Desulfotomaculum sp.]|nr:MAG: hypothetical protein JL56_05115 [Desulfotomaculum sp. BICA1-6]HBX22730.1 flagellar biosynthesis anti-sigma factor FlgM [Desulfotomaculum sp.]
MKITNIGPGALELYKARSEKTQEPPSERAMQEDRAEISSRGRELQKYRDVLKAMPNTRAERVLELKNSITEGTYQPSAEKIAEKIISERRLDTRR